MNKPNESQELRILEVLQKQQGQWVNGQYFGRTMMITQYHRAIYNLQNKRDRYKYDGVIEASPFQDDYGFKFYRLTVDKVQASIFKEVDKKEELNKMFCGY